MAGPGIKLPSFVLGDSCCRVISGPPKDQSITVGLETSRHPLGQSTPRQTMHEWKIASGGLRLPTCWRLRPCASWTTGTPNRTVKVAAARRELKQAADSRSEVHEPHQGDGLTAENNREALLAWADTWPEASIGRLPWPHG